MQCDSCRVEMIARERTASVSAAGLVGALVGLVGLAIMFANALVGIGIIVIGLLMGGLLRKKKLVLVCPKCRREISIP